MTDKVIINASPLIFLSRSHHLALLKNFADEVIIDDLGGRKCADSLDIPVRGTLGLVLAAKRRGVIPKARPVIEDMMSAGLYLSKRVLDRALEKVGE